MKDTTVKPSLIYYTTEYLDFLIASLQCRNESIQVVGTDMHDVFLPLLVKDGPKGCVANSLPFFGGHGGPFLLDQSVKSRKLALVELENRIQNKSYSSVTVVENPFSPITSEEEQEFKYLRVVDSRISQVTHWPKEERLSEQTLLEKYHQKTRNAVRKGLSHLGEVTEDASSEDVFDFLIQEHQTSISQLGGQPKQRYIFENLKTHLSDAVHVYVAYTKENDLAAALLTLEFGDTVEYFTPVVKPEYRESQLLSALIYKVMFKKFTAGFSFWNWGGTWESQTGVHRFKSRFGAEERPYRYFHWASEQIIDTSENDLTKHYPYWYTRKFD